MWSLADKWLLYDNVSLTIVPVDCGPESCLDACNRNGTLGSDICDVPAESIVCHSGTERYDAEVGMYSVCWSVAAMRFAVMYFA